jgi:hypothetical protein
LGDNDQNLLCVCRPASMNEKDTHAIKEINTTKLPREVQRMIVYKMTTHPSPLDVRPSPSRLTRASRREQWKIRPNAWKIPSAYDVPGRGRRPGPSAMCSSSTCFLAARLSSCPCSCARVDRVHAAASTNMVLLVFSTASFAELVAACLSAWHACDGD